MNELYQQRAEKRRATLQAGQVRSYEGRDWTVVKIERGEVELHATDASPRKVLVRSKAWVKREMTIR